MAKEHQVQVQGLHPRAPRQRLLGAGPWAKKGEPPFFYATLPAAAAADLRVRMQGMVLLGQRIEVEVVPPLARKELRAAQTRKAKALRDTTPGFLETRTQLDEQGRYSLTPEVLAMAMAKKNSRARVLDLGCGVGGNAIAFARCGAEVTAVELDPQRAAMARHNASVYGVSDKLLVQCGDALQTLPPRFDGLVFCDPPWGRDWKRHASVIQRYPLALALWEARARFSELWLKLPPAFDPNSLPGRHRGTLRIQLYFGRSEGDQSSPKFLVLRWSSS